MDIGYYIIKLNKCLKSVFSIVGEMQIFCAIIQLYYLKEKIYKNISIEINCIDNKILNTKYLCAMIINRTKSKDVLITGLRLYFRKINGVNDVCLTTKLF